MTRTNKDKRRAYVTRDRIMKLLTDGEVGSVTTAETKANLLDGDEYLDLEQLDHGVQQATATKTPMGRVLPRKAVHEKTWIKILAQLMASGSALAHPGRGR